MSPEQEILYLALRPLLIPNGPGQVPSSIRVRVNEVFSLDGTEGIKVDHLLRIHAVRLVEPGEELPDPINSARDKRRTARQQREARRPGQRRTT